MPEFTEANLESVITTCHENVASIAESLNQCFDRSDRVVVGESRPRNPEESPAELNGPGLVVSFEVGGQGMLCLIPESHPLPGWYTEPNDTQQARLQTLAMEWSMNMLPLDLEAEKFVSMPVADLAMQLSGSEPLAWSGLLELSILDESDEAEPAGEPRSKVLLVWPVEHPPSPQPDEPVAEPAAAPSAAPATAASTAGNETDEWDERTKRLLYLPVQAIVYLAQKKIEVGQLMALSPGALITFNKSCEDQLGLYVNNCLYCRGEAVKIGEKFGLKIDEVSVVEEVEEKILF
jgi:flagellar motor switch protein FliN/FliY